MDPHAKQRPLAWLTDRVMVSLVWVAGGFVLVAFVAIFGYLMTESRYAFDAKYVYGFAFAAQPSDMDPSLPEYADPTMDINATILTVNNEGADSGTTPDEKEERFAMPTLDQLKGVSMVASGALLGGNLSELAPEALFKDDWREPKQASQDHRFVFFVFGTPEYKGKTIRLNYGPFEGADAGNVPHSLKLRMIQHPDGVQVNPIEIDLKVKQNGVIELPSFIANSDAERTKGYAFELVATPTSTSTWAAIQAFFRSEWAPTLAQPRFGLWPLLASTFAITLIALLIATPVSIACAIYLAEIAPVKLREILKPIFELLSSVPTVVLGYFGLIFVAPAIQSTIGKAFGMESGRSLILAAIIMGLLLIPTITTIAEDALRTIPNALRDGAEALGLTRREALRKVVLPAAKSGLVAAVMLGMARSIGETMIVWMLSGGTATMLNLSSPKSAGESLVKSTRGIPDTIGIEMGNVTFQTPHYGYLFLLGTVLFVITLALNMVAFRYARKQVWRA